MLRELIAKHQIDMLLIQETKMEVLDLRICNQIWGDSGFEWQASPAINRGGGLLCVWKQGSFLLQDCVRGSAFIGLLGKWGDMVEDSVVVNVYSSCRIEGLMAGAAGMEGSMSSVNMVCVCVGGL